MKRIVIPDYPDFLVYQTGDTPKLCISAGIHGDEYESIDLMTESLNRYANRIPPFLYIPQVSPSAVTLRTRFNENGFDLNRIFFANSPEPEVRRMTEIIGGVTKFDLYVSLHEDWEYDRFYIYDIGQDSEESEKLKSFNASLKTIGIKLYSGKDDPTDVNLSHDFAEGYHKFTTDKIDPGTGMMEDYLMENGIANEVWIPEIPGLLSKEMKQKLIDKFVKDLLVQE